jgi:hypothetical protein
MHSARHPARVAGRPTFVLGRVCGCLASSRVGYAHLGAKHPFGSGLLGEERFRSMNELEQLARDVREYAIEIRKLGYSSAAGGHENQFLELSDRMIQRANNQGTGTVH